MKWFNQCLGFAFHNGATELRMQVGRPPMADVKDGKFVKLVRTALREKDIVRYARKVFGRSVEEESGPLVTSYECDAGQFEVHYRMTPDGPRLQIKPREGEASLSKDVKVAKPSEVVSTTNEMATVSSALQAAVDAALGDDEPDIEGEDSEPAVRVRTSKGPAPKVKQTLPPSTGGDGPGTRGWLDNLFHTMMEYGASDMHLSAGAVPMLRIDGDMTPIPSAGECTSDDLYAVAMSIAPRRNKEEFDRDHDTDFSYEIDGLGRFRANVFMDKNGVGGVFRSIPTDILTFEQLGLGEPIRKLCHLHAGLVLVTGPTGSGKSTTLAAMIDYINESQPRHIITLEDPIEFVHPHKRCLVNQREVGVHTKGFKRALRAALREDPDIILVGEMRDLETIEIAIETAETGHLVFGTLHTRTAVSTIDRLVDQFPADRQTQIRMMLSGSLKGVISQTLCRKKGGGRVAAMEILLYNRAIANLIRENKTFQIPSLMQTKKNEGQLPLNDALMALVKGEKVEPQEAFIKAADKDNFLVELQRAGFGLDDPTAED